MKKIFILLSRTNTIPARFIRTLTIGEFSHVSVSLLPRTDIFYSYARRKLNNPFFAGLVSENIHTDIFAKYPETHCAVYSINVSDEGYTKAERIIKILDKNKDKATYNFLGAAAMRIGIKLKRKYKFTCSQFVAVVLNRTGEISLPKDPYLMLPNDFTKIPDIELVYDGPLKDCIINK